MEKEKPVTGGDKIEVVLARCYHWDFAYLDGATGYVQRRFVDANNPTVEVLFPPIKSRGQVMRKLPLDAVKRKKEPAS